MQRYFVDYTFDASLIIKDSNQVHHISHVMRMTKGDKVVVCDLNGHCFYMEINRITAKDVHLTKQQALPKLDKKFHVTLAQALIRKDHFELVCQKATELGVDTIIPIETERTNVKLKPDQVDKKRSRWQPIDQETHEQSHRNAMSMLSNIMNLKDLDFNGYDKVFIAYEKEDTITLKQALKTVDTDDKVMLIIGPEGGFSETEINAINAHAQSVSLGPRILRSETAALYALAALSYELEMSE